MVAVQVSYVVLLCVMLCPGCKKCLQAAKAGLHKAADALPAMPMVSDRRYVASSTVRIATVQSIHSSSVLLLLKACGRLLDLDRPGLASDPQDASGQTLLKA